MKEKIIITNKIPVVCERCGRRLTSGMARLGNLGTETAPVPAVVCRDTVQCGALVKIRFGTVQEIETRVYEIDGALADASKEFDVFWAEAKGNMVRDHFKGAMVVSKRFWVDAEPMIKTQKIVLASRDPLGFERQLVIVTTFGVEMLMQIDRVLGGTFLGVVVDEDRYNEASDAFFAAVAQEITVPG